MRIIFIQRKEWLHILLGGIYIIGSMNFTCWIFKVKLLPCFIYYGHNKSPLIHDISIQKQKWSQNIKEKTYQTFGYEIKTTFVKL